MHTPADVFAFQHTCVCRLCVPCPQGEQEREIVRVCVEVALQEAGYNPYYSLLLLRLANASKAHKVTLQVHGHTVIIVSHSV